MDIDRAKIEWCIGNITPRYPNVRFFHVDLYSPYFNPEGVMRPIGYQLPFEPESFDLLIFYSVFSHVLPDAAEMYAGETARLLRPTGSAFLTGYIWTEQTPEELAVGDPRYTFEHDAGEFRHDRPDCPEWGAVSYREEYLHQILSGNGLKITPMKLGAWRREPSDRQDILVISRA